MWWKQGFGLANEFNQNWLVLVAVWSLVWKGLALWRAARKEAKYWFIVMLVLNTAGILPILYLLVWGKEKPKKKGKMK